VFRPTYTGLGERAHLLGPEIDLDTHISDVLGLIEYEELENFHLLGHSYGGMVITGVAERIADKIAGLIYLDAALPEDGQCMLDLILPDRRQQISRDAASKGDGWKIPWARSRTMGGQIHENLEWLISLIGPHPLASMTQPIAISGNHLEVARKTYILAADYDPSPFQKYAAWARGRDDWLVFDLPSNHFPMLTMPERTAALLTENCL
jgi:pimeloyl-ACP methyl ester carboxylesterase